MTSTFPLGPHFPDPQERAVLARHLRQARTLLLTRPAASARWSRGYHARIYLSGLLWQAGERSLHERIGACPMWRGRLANAQEARELGTDGPLLAAKIIAEHDRALWSQSMLERRRDR